MTLGERIKACRKAAKLSQEKVAELVGVSRQAVTKWEADRTAPNTENLFKLAEIFGTTVDMMIPKEESSKQSLAEQIFHLYQAEEAKKMDRQKARRKRNLSMALAVAGSYLLAYLLGRLICGNPESSSLLGWLFGTDSKYYLFGWLTHQGIFWISMAISVLPSLFGKYRFSILTFVTFVLGIIVGEWLGPNPDSPIGQTHYGWAIWGGIFLGSIIAGIVWEIRNNRQSPKSDGTL